MPHQIDQSNISPAAHLLDIRSFWSRYFSARGALLGTSLFVVFLLLALFAPILAPYHYDARCAEALLKPPVWQAGGTWLFPLGSDAYGRDMLSRLIYGAQYGIFIGFTVCLAVSGITAILTVLATMMGKKMQFIIMRLMDILAAYPALLMALLLVNILSPSLMTAIIAAILGFLPFFVRPLYRAVQGEYNKPYVITAKLAGAGNLRLMLKTILPNCLPLLIRQISFLFSAAILTVAAIGFLNLGANTPLPEWGSMLAEARPYLTTDKWWVIIWPGLAILLLVLAVNLVGESLAKAFTQNRQYS